jgi:hypothetical protein
VAEPSEELINFALFALDHATGSVVDSGGPLIPFVLTEVGGQRKLDRFAADRYEESVQIARVHLLGQAARGLDAAVVAWDGYLTVEGRRTDAVFVEASAAGEPESVVLAQRYEKRGLLRRKVAVVGNSALVGRGRSAFATG